MSDLKFSGSAPKLAFDILNENKTLEEVARKLRKFVTKCSAKEFVALYQAVQSLAATREAADGNGRVLVFLRERQTREQWLAENAQPALSAGYEEPQG